MLSSWVLTMDNLLAELEGLLQEETTLWTQIHLPLKWQIFKNSDSLHVIIKIDIVYDDHSGQRAKVLEETVHKSQELHDKVASYLHWACNN